MHESAYSVELVSLQTLPGRYTQLQFRVSPGMAAPQPGHYCRISNDNVSTCMPIMRDHGDVLECLYRNPEAAYLPEHLQDGQLSATLKGNAWNLDPDESHIVFLAQNEGLAGIIHAAGRLHSGKSRKTLTAFLEFDGSPPFTPKPSQILLPGAPAEAVACAPLLEDWGIASRLAGPDDGRLPKPGWFSGTAARLVDTWFESSATGNCRLVCCGSQSFVEAALNLADRRQLRVEATVLPG
jgi:hypothetical protein